MFSDRGGKLLKGSMKESRIITMLKNDISKYIKNTIGVTEQSSVQVPNLYLLSP